VRSRDSNFIYIEVDGHSKLNPAYLTVVLDLVEPMLISRIPSHKIAIVTFYSAQRAGYEKILNSKDARWSGLKLMSVDASQGDEAPFVLLDPVTPGGMGYSLGFRKSHKIAIITFHSAQRAGYEKILNSKDARWSGVKLISVDASQGDEAPFVLPDPVTPDRMSYSLGFHKSMERLRVAPSRARDGFVVVGSPYMANTKYPANSTKAGAEPIQQFIKVDGVVRADSRGCDEVKRRLKHSGDCLPAHGPPYFDCFCWLVWRLSTLIR